METTKKDKDKTLSPEKSPQQLIKLFEYLVDDYVSDAKLSELNKVDKNIIFSNK